MIQLQLITIKKRRSKRDCVKSTSKPKSTTVNISRKSKKSATKRRDRVKRQEPSTKEPETIGRSHYTKIFYHIRYML